MVVQRPKVYTAIKLLLYLCMLACIYNIITLIQVRHWFLLSSCDQNIIKIPLMHILLYRQEEFICEIVKQ